MISIKDQISKDLALRSSAEKLFAYINQLSDTKITLDFSGVTSISRSFAHEYVQNRRTSNKEILEINLSSDIKKMFELVVNNPQKMKLIDEDKEAIEI